LAGSTRVTIGFLTTGWAAAMAARAAWASAGSLVKMAVR
jgi:hypothetical protein